MMWRVAVYAREAPSRRGRGRLAHQVATLAVQVACQPDWCHVATYADQSYGHDASRPGLAQLLADVPGHFDLVVVDDYRRLASNRDDIDRIVACLGGVGVRTAVLGPSAARRFVSFAATVAFADLIVEAIG